MSDEVKPLTAEELAQYVEDSVCFEGVDLIWNNSQVKRLLATIRERDERIKEMEGEDGVIDNSLNRLADRLVVAEADNARLLEALKDIASRSNAYVAQALSPSVEKL